MAKETSAFVRKLAHNDAATRKAAYGSLKAYLQSSSGAKLDLFEFEKLWKGLYFSMWYCDKPVPQQSLAGDLGKLFSEVVPQSQLKAFHQAFWIILSREWHSIDKWRIDKYLMLVRRVVRHMLMRLAANEWPTSETADFLAVLQEYPLCDNVKFPQALGYHVCDLFLDEIEYVVLKDFRDYSEEVDEDDESEAEVSDSEDEGSDEDSDVEPEMPEVPEFPKEQESDEEVDEEGQKKAPKVIEKPKVEDDQIEEKRAVLAKVPMDQLLEPFRELAASAKNQALKQRCKEEILADDRLVSWGVTEKEAESDDEEWTGF